MKLSETEMELVRRLEQREKTWRWARWAAIGVGLLMIGLALIFFRDLWREFAQEELLLMMIAVVAPVCCGFLLFGAGAIWYALAFWKGKPAMRLLLRLIREQDECGRIAG